MCVRLCAKTSGPETVRNTGQALTTPSNRGADNGYRESYRELPRLPYRPGGLNDGHASQVKKTHDGNDLVEGHRVRQGLRSGHKSHEFQAEARAWAVELERELKAQRKRGSVRKDLPSLTIKKLADEYLADPAIVALKYHADLEALVAWWVSHYGSTRCAEFGVLSIREGRETLRASGLSPARCNRYLSAMRALLELGPVRRPAVDRRRLAVARDAP